MNSDGEKKLALPASSHEIVAKILHAYALCGDEPANLDSVAAKAGMNKTQVSGNNGFLVSIGLLTDGKAKALTPAGRTLALAIGHGLDEDSALEWRRTLLGAPAAKGIIDMIRVQKEIPAAALRKDRIESRLARYDCHQDRHELPHRYSSNLWDSLREGWQVQLDARIRIGDQHRSNSRNPSNLCF